MAFNLDDLVGGMRFARQHFCRHLTGLKEGQWDWKPAHECKTIREIVEHRMEIDVVALRELETGSDPGVAACQEARARMAGCDEDRLLALLDETFEELCAFVCQQYADVPLDEEVGLWAYRMKLGCALGYMTSEDYYHAGQVATIRMATDPSWDYYGTIYPAD